MVNLNTVNGADKIVLKYCERLLDLDFDKPLIGVEMGIAYGGGVESLGKLWKERGIVYGYDTFEGHPKHLLEDQFGFEATCMDKWYQDDMYGVKALTLEYQQNELDRQEIKNVILRKGLVNKDSCEDIEYINYALLDMDIYESMKEGYMAVKDKVLPGFCLFFHDATPPNHIPRVHHLLFDEILGGKDRDMWTVIGNWDTAYLVGLKKN